MCGYAGRGSAFPALSFGCRIGPHIGEWRKKHRPIHIHLDIAKPRMPWKMSLKWLLA